MNKHHYIGLEHYVTVLEGGFSVSFGKGSTTVYLDSIRPLSESELNNCMQSNPELVPFYNQKWIELTNDEYKALLDAEQSSDKDKFLTALFSDPSRILASKQYSDHEHKFFDLVEKILRDK